MKVLALDIATRCGIAIGTPGGEPRAWSEDIGKGLPEEQRFSRVLVLTHKLLAEHKPDMVAIEAAIGGPKASSYLVGLVACVRGVCANRQVECKPYVLAAIRKHFLGKHYGVKDFPGLPHAKAKAAIKGKVLERCGLLGWSVPDHDAADAAALLDYALSVNTNHQARVAGGLL